MLCCAVCDTEFDRRDNGATRVSWGGHYYYCHNQNCAHKMFKRLQEYTGAVDFDED